MPEPRRVVVSADRVEVRRETDSLVPLFFGCWLAVFALSLAGLVAGVANVIQDPSWSGIGSVIVLGPLSALWGLTIWGERRPSRVLAGIVSILGGRECVRWRDHGGTRFLVAEVGLPRLPVRWVWLQVPLEDVEVTAGSQQGGGAEISLRVRGSRWYDFVGDHLTFDDAGLASQAINSWRVVPGHHTSQGRDR